jgi:FkbM family methyltransferase
MKVHAVNSGRSLGILSQFPIGLLSRLEPGLMLDVGAAFGGKTVAILEANPRSRVVAYEPFAGNVPYLERLAESDSRVRLRPVAVADRTGTARLYVPSVIDSDQPPWSRLKGASVVGALTHGRPGRSAKTFTVPVVRLDDEVGEHVRFLKIDVQGGEYDVLKGARGLIETHGIDLIYVEFRGDLRVLRFVEAHAYTVFDGGYLAWPTRRYVSNLLRRRTALAIPGWETVREVLVSTGHKAWHVWPPVPFRSFAPYCAWFYATRFFVAGLQTDLLCVHDSFRDRFFQICLDCHAAARSAAIGFRKSHNG